MLEAELILVLFTDSLQQLRWYGAPCNIYNDEPSKNQKLIIELSFQIH